MSKPPKKEIPTGYIGCDWCSQTGVYKYNGEYTTCNRCNGKGWKEADQVQTPKAITIQEYTEKYGHNKGRLKMQLIWCPIFIPSW